LVLTRIDHVGIACRDLDQAIAVYESTFGLAVVSRERNEDQGVIEAMLRVADAPAGTSYVQLLEPLGPDTPVGRFLASRGEGVHHVGYGVTDITAALAAIGATGVRLIDSRPRLDGCLNRLPASEGRRRRADRTGASGRIRLILPPGSYGLAARMAAAQAPQAPPEQRLVPALTAMLVRNLPKL
jgi:methylmalonyl-CoA/ethylmalonyl-CoA epimerase